MVLRIEDPGVLIGFSIGNKKETKGIVILLLGKYRFTIQRGGVNGKFREIIIRIRL